MTMEQRVQALLDRQEIERILTLYPRAIDRLDLELLQSLYHPDARDEHADFKGTAREFAAAIIPWLRDLFVATMHHVTHYHIDLFGNFAAAESYYYAYHRMEGDFDKIAGFFGPAYASQCREAGTLGHGHEFICGGRYIDLFERRDGVWLIADREITVEWKHIRPATPSEPDTELAKIIAPPGRDRDDIAYRFVERARKAGWGASAAISD